MDNRSVLVVDDDEAFGCALAEMLRFLDFDPSVCTTAQQALNLAKVHPFQLVLADIRMPGTDGFAFHRFLSITNKPLSQRLIFVTGDNTNPETRELVGKTGAVCLEKPVHFEELERAIAETLARTASAGPVTDPPPAVDPAISSDQSSAAGSPTPEPGANVQEPQAILARLEKEWSQALLQGDHQTIDRLLDGDFTATHHSGTTWSRVDYLAGLKRCSRPPASMVYEDLQVRAYGECAVVTARVSARGENQDVQVQGQYRLTNTWLRRAGQWRCVASHASLVKLTMDLEIRSPFGASLP